MAVRVTDELVRKWLVWAYNYEEIESYEAIRVGRRRMWKIRIREGIRKNAMEPLFRPRWDDIVPSEIVLTTGEALAFAMGCAVGGTSKDRREWTPEDWEEQARNRPREETS